MVHSRERVTPLADDREALYGVGVHELSSCRRCGVAAFSVRTAANSAGYLLVWRPRRNPARSRSAAIAV